MKKLSTIKKKIEAEIVLIKEQGDDYTAKNEDKILDALKDVTGYEAKDYEEDRKCLVKVHNTEEFWQYFLDTIIPKLEGNTEEKPEEKKDEKPDTMSHEGRYQFTDEDKRVLSQDLAEQCLSMATIEAEKKRVVSEFKAKIDACDAKIQKLSEKISNGHEYRTFDCIVEKDFENKSIRYIDVDTDKVIEERKMTPHEYQLAITDKQVD